MFHRRNKVTEVLVIWVNDDRTMIFEWIIALRTTMNSFHGWVYIISWRDSVYVCKTWRFSKCLVICVFFPFECRIIRSRLASLQNSTALTDGTWTMTAFHTVYETLTAAPLHKTSFLNDITDFLMLRKTWFYLCMFYIWSMKCHFITLLLSMLTHAVVFNKAFLTTQDVVRLWTDVTVTQACCADG